MTRQQFSALLLDLRPDGGHSWVDEVAADGAVKQAMHGLPQPEGDSQPQVELKPFDQEVLAVSDAIARARLAAARGTDKFYPNMITFGWAAVIVSALATMFVTLRSTISPTPSAQEGTFGWHWHRFWLFAFGFLAIGFSTTATVLASAKQFWDPTAAYMRNEGALVSLRQLHEQIALYYASSANESCQVTDTGKLAGWIATLVSLEPGTIAAPVLIPVASSSSNPSPQVPQNNSAPKGGEQTEPATSQTTSK